LIGRTPDGRRAPKSISNESLRQATERSSSKSPSQALLRPDARQLASANNNARAADEIPQFSTISIRHKRNAANAFDM
jgi:hypothetical protein